MSKSRVQKSWTIITSSFPRSKNTTSISSLASSYSFPYEIVKGDKSSQPFSFSFLLIMSHMVWTLLKYVKCFEPSLKPGERIHFGSANSSHNLVIDFQVSSSLHDWLPTENYHANYQILKVPWRTFMKLEEVQCGYCFGHYRLQHLKH